MSPLQRGDAVIVPAGVASKWRCSDGEAYYDMLHIYVHSGLLAKAAVDIDFDVSPADIKAEFPVRDPHISHIGLVLLQELGNVTSGSRAYLDLLATQLAMHLLRRRPVNNASGQPYKGSIPRYKLRCVIDYISDNLSAELKFAEIAEADVEGTAQGECANRKPNRKRTLDQFSDDSRSSPYACS